MYSREVEGEELTFGVSGKLIRNALVMYDRQSESLWSQLLGEAVSGEYLGSKLEYLPSWHTTWKAWKEMHPDTLALKKGFGGRRDPYASYYQSGATGIIRESTSDDRFPAKEFVVGVEFPDGSAKAYPYRFLSLNPVINDSVGDERILVTFEPETGASAVFDRRVGEQTLTFKQVGTGSPIIEDDATGSKWNALTGEAIEGSFSGQQLNRVKSTASFWFGWKDYHPDTALFEPKNEPPG